MLIEGGGYKLTAHQIEVVDDGKGVEYSELSDITKDMEIVEHF